MQDAQAFSYKTSFERIFLWGPPKSTCDKDKIARWNIDPGKTKYLSMITAHLDDICMINALMEESGKRGFLRQEYSLQGEERQECGFRKSNFCELADIFEWTVISVYCFVWTWLSWYQILPLQNQRATRNKGILVTGNGEWEGIGWGDRQNSGLGRHT